MVNIYTMREDWLGCYVLMCGLFFSRVLESGCCYSPYPALVPLQFQLHNGSCLVELRTKSANQKRIATAEEEETGVT